MNARGQGLIRTWLWGLYGLVLVMVVLGGVTRLTGSGLSMVEWSPLFGAIPPLNDEEWQQAFTRYQAFPQYQQVNSWMTLVDFKRIFFWEYLHRLVGRLVGIFFLVPFLFLWGRGYLVGAPKLRILLTFLLGGLQGLLGWLMVKSGLVDRPEVSHVRLAAHLLLAFFVAHWILWLIFDLRPETSARPRAPSRAWWPWMLVLLVGTQITWGAFMAGRKAGHLYRSFPDFCGQLLPDALWQEPSWWSASVNSPVGIHVVHRLLGYLVLVAVCAAWWRLGRFASLPGVGGARLRLLIMGLVQFALGALTVIYGVPTVLAVAHQLGGFFLLSSCVEVAYLLSHLPSHRNESNGMPRELVFTPTHICADAIMTVEQNISE